MVKFSELRAPMRWYIKLLTAISALVFFAVLATLAIAGFLVYRIVKPQRTSSEINLQSFPGRPDAVAFSAGEAGPREGLFFPGFRGVPTIVLCHGYGSSKGELLTLVSALQDHQYNVFVFDFAAHGATDGITTFGYREAEEVRAALDVIAARNDVDRGLNFVRFVIAKRSDAVVGAVRRKIKNEDVVLVILQRRNQRQQFALAGAIAVAKDDRGSSAKPWEKPTLARARIARNRKLNRVGPPREALHIDFGTGALRLDDAVDQKAGDCERGQHREKHQCQNGRQQLDVPAHRAGLGLQFRESDHGVWARA